MKTNIARLLMAAFTVMLMACAQEAPPPVEETIIADQVKALEKAKALEEEMLKAAEERKKAMEDQGG